MPLTQKKFLNAAGVAHLGEILDEYPNNQVLATVIDAIQDELDTKAPNTLATHTTPGLMSETDKMVLDNLNPNIVEELTPLADSIYITNAKQENLIDCLFRFEPKIGTRIHTSNLLDVSNNTPGYYIGSSGNNASNANDRLGPFIPVEPGQDIYYTGIVGETTSSSINRRLHVYNSNQTWIKQMSFAGSLKVGNSWSTHGVVPSNGAYVRVSWGVNDTNVMISVGSPAKYEPYEITPYIPLSTVANPGIVTIHQYTDPEMTEGRSYNFEIPAAAGSIYACRINPITGTLISTTGFIDSYNGETLPGLWFSDRDEYTEDTTPTIGAQVVYALNEEDYVEYDLIPLVIPMYYHDNYFYCQDGIILSFTYYAETLAVNHITLQDGIKFGNTNITEQDVINWNNGSNLTIDDTINNSSENPVQNKVINTALNSKANLASPTFTGSPKAPTPTTGDDTTKIATTAFVNAAITNALAGFSSGPTYTLNGNTLIITDN